MRFVVARRYTTDFSWKDNNDLPTKFGSEKNASSCGLVGYQFSRKYRNTRIIFHYSQQLTSTLGLKNTSDSGTDVKMMRTLKIQHNVVVPTIIICKNISRETLIIRSARGGSRFCSSFGSVTV